MANPDPDHGLAAGTGVGLDSSVAGDAADHPAPVGLLRGPGMAGVERPGRAQVFVGSSCHMPIEAERIGGCDW